MKTKHIICLVIFIISACDKPPFNDLGGNSTISGIVLLNDQYTDAGKYVPLSGLTVYLRNISDTFSYLYTAKTDKSGFFSFNGIDLGVSYRIDATYDSAKIRYRGKLDLGPANPASKSEKDSLILHVDPTAHNGIHLTVKDYSGGPIPFAEVWVFNSLTLFESDTMAGLAFTMKCDEFGVANQYDVSPGDYYFRVKVRSGNKVLVDEEKTNVEIKGIRDVGLTVNSIPSPGSGNGLSFLVKDQQGEAVDHASVYFYNNYEAYLQDSGSLKKQLFMLTSNNSGMVATYVINPNSYFVWARKVINTKDTIYNREYFQINVGTTVTSGNDLILK